MSNNCLLCWWTGRAWTRWAVLPLLLVLADGQASALEIWNGPSITFSNAPGSDPALPESQDRLTANVWLTRGYVRGLYNAAVETSYSSLSPIGTEWAYGELANYASLGYQSWVAWNNQNPPAMVGQDAVLHLIPDNAYLAIQFTFWNIGSGGFAYTRSTPPVPEPSSAGMVLAAIAALAGIERWRRWAGQAPPGVSPAPYNGTRRPPPPLVSLGDITADTVACPVPPLPIQPGPALFAGQHTASTGVGVSGLRLNLGQPEAEGGSAGVQLCAQQIGGLQADTFQPGAPAPSACGTLQIRAMRKRCLRL